MGHFGSDNNPSPSLRAVVGNALRTARHAARARSSRPPSRLIDSLLAGERRKRPRAGWPRTTCSAAGRRPGGGLARHRGGFQDRWWRYQLEEEGGDIWGPNAIVTICPGLSLPPCLAFTISRDHVFLPALASLKGGSRWRVRQACRGSNYVVCRAAPSGPCAAWQRSWTAPFLLVS